MPRKKEYTKSTLDRAVERYFKRITRLETLKDREGVPIVNQLGETVMVTEYLEPPTVSGLCEALKITRATWNNYAGDPELRPIVVRARERMQAWNERELLIREGKDLKGIIFNLENNYGYRERHQMEVHGGVEEYLRKLEESDVGSSGAGDVH